MRLPQFLDFRDELGGDEAVLLRTRSLTAHARRALLACGFAPATPSDPGMSGAMIAFDFRACDPVKARNWLWQKHRIECPLTQSGDKYFLRVSCAWFNTSSEIDALAAAASQAQRSSDF